MPTAPAAHANVQQAPELNPALELYRPPREVELRGAHAEVGARGRRGTDIEAWSPAVRTTRGQLESLTPDRRPAGSEKARILSCAGSLNDTTRAHVATVLRRRFEASPKDPGTDRFLVLGASASRAQSFLNDFGTGDYTLSPDWEFLRPTIEHFAQRPRPLNSFRRKHATVSGTTAGSFIWSTSFCPECPQKLEDQLRILDPAYAIVMFGTNNVSWGGPPGFKGLFDRRVAASYRDDWCRHVPCLPPWEPGPLEYHSDRAEQHLPEYIERVMARKVELMQGGHEAVIRKLLAHDIVPVLTTVPPMPRKWIDEDTVYAINAAIRELGEKHRIPVIDFWCALSPQTADGRLDWSHPVLTGGKGIGSDRYHPTTEHAFDVSDENLVYGYNARNVLTLLRLHELREFTRALEQARAREATEAAASP